jgi:hypothetical protein
MEVEQISASSLKTLRECITKVRWRVEDFTSRLESDQSSSIQSKEFKFFGAWCHFILYFGDYEMWRNEYILQIPSYKLHFLNLDQWQNIQCRLWLENENGEKCSKQECKSLSQSFLFNFINL